MNEHERKKILKILTQRAKVRKEEEPPKPRNGWVLIFAGNHAQYTAWVNTIGFDLGYRPGQCRYISEANILYGVHPDNEHILDVVVTGTFQRTRLATNTYIDYFIRSWRERLTQKT